MTPTAEQLANRETWITALETTDHPQGRMRLGDPEFGYCCLGLGCAVLDIEFKPYVGTSESFREAVGLATDDGSFMQAPGYFTCLTAVNDSDKLTFRQIAKILRENKTMWIEGVINQDTYNG